MPIIKPSNPLRGKVLRNHDDGLFLEFLGQARVMLERAILPGALAALAGEIGAYLVRHVFGENFCHLGGCKRKKHTMSVTGRFFVVELVMPSRRLFFWR